jgi:phage tail sheath gpL-like
MMKQNQKFTFVDSAIVDGEQWYTIEPRDSDIWGWIKQQESQRWVEHTAGYAECTQFCIDMDEHLYSLLLLRWS